MERMHRFPEYGSSMTTVTCVGLAVLDLVFGVETRPDRGRKTFADSMTLIGGGPAANAAVAVACLDGNARFVGRLGDDIIGDLIIDDFANWVLMHPGSDALGRSHPRFRRSSWRPTASGRSSTTPTRCCSRPMTSSSPTISADRTPSSAICSGPQGPSLR
ncbi:MAG: hypothetical protein DRJ50_02030 [Actinobacteria bacterium]|nr:MAG: hypothetical protein DRJ50_02030 [Actinomycetota bacterium]